ncbi:sulfatase-like hydrolase/transferase [Mangrovimonas sp. DI 80]|uniref:sulfatase-like hydrolase/transferase n=1 Tax=Mangrovimonas sp. DI 80 TaxID=1779330 RepID=UPI0015C54060|nr:sulfatase-like hydrolase/transferase [Mangrovimonas sp. DI 80]
MTNFIYHGILYLKKFIQKHNFNNPPKAIRYNIVVFLLFIGFLSGIVLVTFPKIPFLLFNVEEPFVSVYLKNTDPFNKRISAVDNEDIGIRHAYPENLDFEKKNIIIIVVDALRSDHLSLFGYQRETSPFLDSLYASGNLRKIDLSFSVSGESFSGINAILRSKIWANMGYNNFSLQQLLKDQGYDLNFIISGDHTNFYGLKSFYGKNSDFNYYLDGAVSKKYSDPNDDRILFEGLENIGLYNNTPAYFHFHLMSVHNLGTRLNKFKRYTPAGTTTFDAENYINRYDNGVLQADNFLKNIFSILSKKGYLQNSIVVITGDHGEALGERGLFGHGRNIYTNQILSPILIYDTEKLEYKNTSYATLVDIAPTIVDRLGLPIPESWEGISLFSEETNRQLTFHQENNDYAIIHTQGNKRHKLIYNSKTGKQELYELNTDLYETKNIIDSLNLEYVNTLRWHMNEFHLNPEKLYRLK